MVLKPDVLARAIDHASENDNRPRLLMSPRGKPLTQKRVRELASGDGVIIVCGRFEGVDQRVIDGRGLEEISIGDYILSGGEPAALILLDAIVRILPGVMGNDLSGLRYGKVIILADADSDGLHIATLLSALFLRHFPALVREGHV